jgi:hypothetical protein
MFVIKAALAVLAVVAATTAYAGSQEPCDRPRVFEGAALSSLVLPYRYVGAQSTPELERASREISGLVHFEVLFGFFKYGAVGGTNLVAAPRAVCDVDEVVRIVSQSGGQGTLRPGQTVVVTWGRLFEQGDQLHVQTFVRFFKQGAGRPLRESIDVRLSGDGSVLDLIGTLSTQAIAFPPRRISRQDLTRVANEFKNAMVVRPEKDLGIPGKSIDFAPDKRFPYGITRTDGDWMWIQPLAGGPAGWVRARVGDAGANAWSLQRWLPELAYIDAVGAFMRLRAGSGAIDPAARTRFSAAMEARLSQFESTVPATDAAAAHGLANAMRGFVLWQQGPGPQRTEAARRFAQAVALMPEYAAARNLAAITRPLLAEGTVDARSMARLGRNLTGALALDPADRIVLDNIERVYELYAARSEWSPHPSDQVQDRLAVVRETRARLPARN